MPWRQVEVDAFMRTITSGVRPTRPAVGVDATGVDGSRRSRRTARSAGSAPALEVSPISSDAESDGAGDLCRDHARPVARRLLQPRDVRNQRRTTLGRRRLRRMLCDAVVYPTVLGGNGEVLDSGRAERTVNRKQRRALRAMHRTCAHPGCTVGFDSCRIHHIRWWTRDRGPTDLANMLPLCEDPPPPRPRRRLDAHNDSGPDRHLDPTRRHPLEDDQHRRPCDRRARRMVDVRPTGSSPSSSWSFASGTRGGRSAETHRYDVRSRRSRWL